MSRSSVRPVAFLAAGLVAAFFPFLGASPSHAEQASSPPVSRVALSAGGPHTCAILVDRTLRCWGRGDHGELGYANTASIGDDETVVRAGRVHLGKHRTALAVAAASNHTCAILDNHRVRCWGRNSEGELGYGNTRKIGDDEVPGSAGPVRLGRGRTAVALAAGARHTCAVLDNHKVRCWGNNLSGQLGYGNRKDVGDNETPASVGPVHLGKGRTALAIAAGAFHTCAILDNHTVRCWGNNASGQLGYANRTVVGDNETPASAGPVDLGPGRTAVALAAGATHTCAVLDDHSVRCWGANPHGQLGYGNTRDIGDDESPATAGPVDLGPGRTAVALTAAAYHTCAILDDHTVRCWGGNFAGQLGYGNTRDIGDDEAPGTVGPVDLGAGRTALAISAGNAHTCAVLDDRSVRCWGANNRGQLGYGSTVGIGNDQTPGTVGPLALPAPVQTAG